jgi:resuscitation-promoting factor RpfB
LPDAPGARSSNCDPARSPRESTLVTEPSGCDPNYSGCVPIASDVDCAGGSGNGPAYVSGPVRVVGTDKYGLDNDKDGLGCE